MAASEVVEALRQDRLVDFDPIKGKTMFRISCLAVLLASTYGVAQPPKLDIPKELTPVQGYVIYTPSGDTVKSVTYVSLTAGIYPMPTAILADKRMFVIDASRIPVGRYDFVAVGASPTGEQATASFTVVIGDAPLPPVPPGPNPPVPPGPTPDPKSPFAGETGLHILITYDPKNQVGLTGGQREIINSEGMGQYLDSITPVGPDGKKHTWRIWPADSDVSSSPKKWADAFSRPRKSPNWVYIGNGKSGYEGPLSDNPTELQMLINKYK